MTPTRRYEDKYKLHFSDIFKSNRTLLAEEIAFQALKRERAREKAEKEAAEKKAAENAATGKNDADKKDGESSPKQKSDKGSTSKLISPVWNAEHDTLLAAMKSLNKSWKEISLVMDNRPIAELKKRWAQQRSAATEAEKKESAEAEFKAALEAGIKAALEAEKKAEAEKVGSGEADIKAVIEARVQAAIEAEKKAQAEKAEAEKKAAATAKEASIEAEIRAIVEERVRAVLAGQGIDTAEKKEDKKEENGKQQDKKTRRVSFSDPLIIPGKTDSAASSSRRRESHEPKVRPYIETKLSLDEILLLHKLEARFEREKWLHVASRFFDKTGKRITPEEAKVRFQNKASYENS
ncbi:hypothetical protein DTO271D3_8211 [Paecilomyces variotii]|nr:hypothetical protein DTO212C5_9188 [Paecilomyces variotii]KAJ9311493.1 hypothetical protein DTO271D3_8211 [Paecilomyces variotii]KAJ9322436.1 hypothetical protein DTO027B3_6568 [Paecilomyces variotii]KAJ9337925.1 hypothetical protein DTO027B5_77 [Paecilomyces variotii]KAJ9371040.1 hypothetical protein DTO282E5_4337 [Paecilomyces variotii]